MSKEEAKKILRDAHKGQDVEFRPGQWESIDALINHNKRLLVVQRTGWGKSYVYFISTRILRNRGLGPTLIVSPLLALMRNQIDMARRFNVNALSINSTNKNEWPELKKVTKNNEADVLLISPERLANEEFYEEVLIPIASNIGLIVIDEAHCISDWGHDFRPDYKRLKNVIKQIPKNIPILCTTATANDRVVEDIESQIEGIEIVRGGLIRESLSLQTLHLPSHADRLAWIMQNINDLPYSGIIYTSTIRDADRVADWLSQNDVDAKAYHADLRNDDRESLEEQLLKNKLKVLVATTALGMGFDKPDLGFVIHYQTPDSIISYYQQVGRAGREINDSFGVLMFGKGDEEIQAYFRNNAFPSEELVQSILEILEEDNEGYDNGMTIRELEKSLNLRQGQIKKVVKYLSVENPSPIICHNNKWQRTPVPYSLDHENIKRLTNQRETEWDEIKAYIDEKDCLMEHLANALDDKNAKPCGKCSSCLGQPIIPENISKEILALAHIFLKRSEFPLICQKQIPSDAFIEYDLEAGNLPLDLRADEGRILSYWKDDGWGRIVQEDKYTNENFRDELVEVIVEMIRERWQPTPYPEWVTCIPSNSRPHLVKGFAEKLAKKLDLKFIDSIKKVKKNDPQKLQMNRFHQCRNLDGVFEIDNSIPNSPVFLIDDIAHSKWTMTIASALLRQNGSGRVLPIALTSLYGS